METTKAAPASGSGSLQGRTRARQVWRALVPVAVVAIIALMPAPAGLYPHAWYYFAIFAGVVAALVLDLRLHLRRSISA